MEAYRNGQSEIAPKTRGVFCILIDRHLVLSDPLVEKGHPEDIKSMIGFVSLASLNAAYKPGGGGTYSLVSMRDLNLPQQYPNEPTEL